MDDNNPEVRGESGIIFFDELVSFDLAEIVSSNYFQQSQQNVIEMESTIRSLWEISLPTDIHGITNLPRATEADLTRVHRWSGVDTRPVEPEYIRWSAIALAKITWPPPKETEAMSVAKLEIDKFKEALEYYTKRNRPFVLQESVTKYLYDNYDLVFPSAVVLSMIQVCFNKEKLECFEGWTFEENNSGFYYKALPADYEDIIEIPVDVYDGRYRYGSLLKVYERDNKLYLIPEYFTDSILVDMFTASEFVACIEVSKDGILLKRKNYKPFLTEEVLVDTLPSQLVIILNTSLIYTFLKGDDLERILSPGEINVYYNAALEELFLSNHRITIGTFIGTAVYENNLLQIPDEVFSAVSMKLEYAAIHITMGAGGISIVDTRKRMNNSLSPNLSDYIQES